MPSLQTKASPTSWVTAEATTRGYKVQVDGRARPLEATRNRQSRSWMMWPQAILVQALQPATKWALCSRWPMLHRRGRQGNGRAGAVSGGRPGAKYGPPQPAIAASPASSNSSGLARPSSTT